MELGGQCLRARVRARSWLYFPMCTMAVMAGLCPGLLGTSDALMLMEHLALPTRTF